MSNTDNDNKNNPPHGHIHGDSPYGYDHHQAAARLDRWTVGKVVKRLIMVAIFGVLLKAAWMVYKSRTNGIPLAIKWEGAFLDPNSRDVGASINQCLGRPLMREGVIQRASVWFSGWACSKVGSPDVIFSLNFDPSRNERYFCKKDDTNIIGRHYGTKVLNDLEFLESWEDPAMRSAACQYIQESFAEIADQKKILVHCDAGRDRTGTYSALITALTAESMGRLNAEVLEAIECDYQKSRSLLPSKFGRMRRLIENLIETQGVRGFMINTCKIPPKLIDAAVRRMAAEK
jgi:hypothetical protein